MGKNLFTNTFTQGFVYFFVINVTVFVYFSPNQGMTVVDFNICNLYSPFDISTHLIFIQSQKNTQFKTPKNVSVKNNNAKKK